MTRTGRSVTAATLALMGIAMLISACRPGTSDELTRVVVSAAGAIPQRVVAFDVVIETAGSDPIEVRVNRSALPLTVEVPPGSGATVSAYSLYDAGDELLPDVYLGRRQVTIPAGQETSVAVEIVPGPAFPVYRTGPNDAGLDADEGFLAQIRDLGIDGAVLRDQILSSPDDGVGRRRIPGQDVTVRPLDVHIGPSGEVWAKAHVESDQFIFGEASAHYSLESFEVEAQDVVAADGAHVMAIAVDRFRSTVAFYLGWWLESGLYVIAIDEMSNLDSPTALNEHQKLSSTEVHPERITVVSGLAFDADGHIYVLGVGPDAQQNLTVYLEKLDGESGEPVGEPVEIAGDVPWYQNSALTPVGDVHVAGEQVFVVVAVGDGAPVRRYDRNLELQDSWGTLTTSGAPAAGQFWGPRRFIANRLDDLLIVIDQQDDDGMGNGDGRGRLVGFRMGDTASWQSTLEDAFDFFTTQTSVP